MIVTVDRVSDGRRAVRVSTQLLVQRRQRGSRHCRVARTPLRGLDSAGDKCQTERVGRVAYGVQVGSTIGRYRIDELIGRGGMGVVFGATHTRLNMRVALKILSPDLADDEIFRERFIRESELAASLDHPSVIPIYDADEVEGVLYLAMRHVQGLDLERTLEQRGRLGLAETVKIVEAVAAALDEAHAHDLFHRDVKPANILIERGSGHVYLTDFGLARLGSATGFTRTGSFLGTVHYCAPEQIEGKKVDGRTDIYALGCVLYHCLAGQPPFPRESEVAVIHAHLTDPPPALSSVRTDLPRFLDGVVVTAMAKFPEVRYSTGAELVKALRQGESATASTLPRAEPARPHAPPTVIEPVLIDPPPPTAGNGRRRIHRNSWYIGVAAAAVALGAAATAALVVLSHSSNGHAGAKTSPAPTALKPLASAVARRMTKKLIPAQRSLTRRVADVSRTRSAFVAMETAAGTVRTAVLQTQGWSGTGLVPHTNADAAVKRLFTSALAAQVAYAKSIEGLPSDPARLTRPLATRVINLADRAEEAYARLSGAAPALPGMPLHRADHVRLLQVVAAPKPRTVAPPAAPRTVRPPAQQHQSSTTDDQAAVAEVITEHWQAINDGDYERAYSYFSPQLRSQFSRSNWIKDKLVDQPHSSAISIQSISIQGDTAYAYVTFRTIGQERSAGNTGCNSWAGSYRFVRAGSNWYLDKSTLHRTSHDCSSFSL